MNRKGDLMSFILEAAQHSKHLARLPLGGRIAYLAGHFTGLTFYSDAGEADQVMSWAIATYGSSITIAPTERVVERDELKILFDITRDRYDLDVPSTISSAPMPKAILSSDYAQKAPEELLSWDEKNSCFVARPFADYSKSDLLNLLFAHEIPVNFPLSGLTSQQDTQFSVERNDDINLFLADIEPHHNVISSPA